MKEVIKSIKDKYKDKEYIENISKIYKSIYFKYFIIIFIIYMVALFPLFRANYNYIDDLGRVRSGYAVFGFDRYISNFLAVLVHGDTYLTDISPFPQVLAVIIISITSTILIKLINNKNNNKLNIWNIIAVLPFGLSPYYLENLSYKFDSPYMATSLFVSVLPFLYYKKNKENKNYLFIILSIICTIIMCTTYQASSGIYPQITLILAFIMINEKNEWKDIIKFIIISIISFVLGLLIFKIFIMSPTSTYIDNSILGIKELIPGAIKNYTEYFRLLYSDFKLVWMMAILVTMISFIIISVINTKQKKIVTFIISVLVLMSLGLLSFGVYPFIKLPLFDPRSMYGVGVAIAIISLFCINNKHSYLSKATILYIGYVFFIIALTYGNAVAEQKRYTEFRINLLVNDLNQINLKQDETLLLDIKGDIGYVETLDGTISRNKIIKRLIPTGFSDDSWLFGSLYFYDYYNLPNIKKSEEVFEFKDMKLYKDTRYHSIYKKDNKLLIDLK